MAITFVSSCARRPPKPHCLRDEEAGGGLGVACLGCVWGVFGMGGRGVGLGWAWRGFGGLGLSLG